MRNLSSHALSLIVAFALSGCVTPDRNQSGLTSGISSEIKGEFDDAISTYTRALSGGSVSGDERAILYVRRAYAYIGKGDFDKAIADADAAIQLNPIAEFTYNARASANFRKQQYDLAIADWDVAIRLKPLPNLFHSRGSAHVQNGQLDQALDDYNEAIRLRPRFADAYESRGNLLIRRGDYERGLIDFDHAIGIQPDNGYAYNGRGLAYARAGQYEKAHHEFVTALIFQPKAALFYANRAHMAYSLGRYDAAAADMAEAVRLMPAAGIDVVWLHLFRHKMRQNDQEEFARNVAAISQQPWPHAIASVYLGTMAPEQLHKMVEQASAEAYPSVMCQATFHVGYARFLRGETGTARPAMQEAAKICPPLSTEQWMASSELKTQR